MAEKRPTCFGTVNEKWAKPVRECRSCPDLMPCAAEYNQRAYDRWAWEDQEFEDEEAEG